MTRRTVDGVEFTETGSLITVYISRAGGLLDGDHPAGSTQLAVQLGWDFDPNGGTLSLGETVYTYTSAVIEGEPLPDLPDDPDDEEPPDPNDGWEEQTGEDVDVDEWETTENDDRPTIITLIEPLTEDAIDGDLVALEPESITKSAEVQLADFDEPINARIPHGLMDRIAEGSRGDLQSAETVAVRLDGATWVVDDVMGKPPAIEADALDPDGPPLPGQLIPGEGWEYMGPIAPESISTGTLQSKVQIGEQLWTVKYADPTDPDSPPDPDSAIISITADDGIRLQTPTGSPDAQGDPTLITQVHLPTYLTDENGERITARLSGIADLASAETRQITIDGSTDDGHQSALAAGTRLQLNNAVADPTDAPQVQFVPDRREWPTSGGNWLEYGFGLHGANIVYAARHADAGTTRFRFINADTGVFDHDVFTTRTFDNIAGFAVANSLFYVLGRRNGNWRIHQFSPNGALLGNSAVMLLPGPAAACLGTTDGVTTLALRNMDNDRVAFWRYGANLIPQAATGYLTDYTTNRWLYGFDLSRTTGGWLWNGSYIARLDAHNGTLLPFNEAASFWSGVGVASGGGKLPNGEPATLDGQGTIARYNTDAIYPSQTWFAITRWRSRDDTESAPSPILPATWPSRMFALVQGPAPVAGADGIQFYASSTQPSTATDLALQGNAVGLGAAAITLAKIGSGAAPPTKSEFTTATSTPAEIVSQGMIPGTSRRALDLRASGYAELHGLIQPWVSRSNNAGQTLPVNTWVRITWPVATVTHSDIAYNNGVFTVNHSGAYLISAQSTVTGFPANTRFACRLLKNDVSIARVGQHATGSTFCTTGVYGLKLQLVAGDRLQFEVHQNSDSSQLTNTATDQNWIQITRDHA